MEKERIIANYSGYGILDKDKNSDGVNNLIQESAQRLKSKGYRVILLGPLVGGKEEDNVADVTVGKAIRIPRPIARRYGTSFPVTLPYFKEEAAEVLDRIKPDIFVIDEPLLPGYGVHTIMSGMPRREDGKPIPVTIDRFHSRFEWDLFVTVAFNFGNAARRLKFDRNGLPIGLTDGWFKTITKALYGTAVSDVTRDFVREHYGIDCEVIHNGIDTDWLTPKGPLKEDWEEQRRNGKKIFYSPGRIEGRKGQPYLVDACEILKKRGLDFVLYLGGDGVDKESVQKMVKRKGLQEDVIFVGNLPFEEYSRALRTADVCPYPATGNEGFGRAPVEAAASGSIPVVSEIDGYNEAVKDMPFVLRVKPKDSLDLANKIADGSKVSEEKRRELGVANHNHVHRRFGWEVIVDKQDRFYDNRYRRHGGVDWSKLPRSGTLFTKKG